MNFLYVDNYRGFKKEMIKLKNVNFLVGENSTGKTSILSLIKLLGTPYFWLNPDFNDDNVSLGNFKDIVSIWSDDRSFFKIGLLEYKPQNSIENITDDNENDPFAILLTFKELDGQPKISKCEYIAGLKKISIKFTKSIIKYKVEETPQINSENDLLAMFKSWNEINDEDLNYKSLSGELSKNRINSLSYIMNYVEEKISIENDFNRKILKRSKTRTLMIRAPEFSRNLTWIAPIRSKPKRIYDQYKHDFSPEGDHAPYIIQKFLGNKKIANEFLKDLKSFGINSNLFENVNVTKYGKNSASPFELNIQLNGKNLNVTNVGYGVSQSLPVIVDLIARPNHSWYAIQQPEVHLHPKAQAALGDMFYKLSSDEKKNFIIETHSDYTIDRFRLNILKEKSYVDSQILFFERNDKFNKIHNIEILQNGQYSENQPKAFREFFIKEQIKILEI